jgi:biotin synthase
MPNITDTRFRDGYQLYEGKPGQNENALAIRKALEESIHSIGETIGYDEWGDSPHFRRKTSDQS